MACKVNDSEIMSSVELVIAHGLDGLPAAITHLINGAMRLERERYLQADLHERSSERVG